MRAQTFRISKYYEVLYSFVKFAVHNDKYTCVIPQPTSSFVHFTWLVIINVSYVISLIPQTPYTF